MRKTFKVLIISSIVFFSPFSLSETKSDQELIMLASGTFEIKLEPVKFDTPAVGRMIISKQYSGGMVGTGDGQMISKRTDSGEAVYSAIEEFEGAIDDKKGGFTLFHKGSMSNSQQSLEITIVEGSGTGEFEGISGAMSIIQESGSHSYQLDYSF